MEGKIEKHDEKGYLPYYGNLHFFCYVNCSSPLQSNFKCILRRMCR